MGGQVMVEIGQCRDRHRSEVTVGMVEAQVQVEGVNDMRDQGRDHSLVLSVVRYHDQGRLHHVGEDLLADCQGLPQHSEADRLLLGESVGDRHQRRGHRAEVQVEARVEAGVEIDIEIGGVEDLFRGTSPLLEGETLLLTHQDLSVVMRNEYWLMEKPFPHTVDSRNNDMLLSYRPTPLQLSGCELGHGHQQRARLILKKQPLRIGFANKLKSIVCACGVHPSLYRGQAVYRMMSAICTTRAEPGNMGPSNPTMRLLFRWLLPPGDHCHPLLLCTDFSFSRNSLDTFSSIAQDGICTHRYEVHHQLRTVRSSTGAQLGLCLQRLLRALCSPTLNAALLSQPTRLPQLHTLSTP